MKKIKKTPQPVDAKLVKFTKAQASVRFAQLVDKYQNIDCDVDRLAIEREFTEHLVKLSYDQAGIDAGINLNSDDVFSTKRPSSVMGYDNEGVYNNPDERHLALNINAFEKAFRNGKPLVQVINDHKTEEKLPKVVQEIEETVCDFLQNTELFVNIIGNRSAGGKLAENLKEFHESLPDMKKVAKELSNDRFMVYKLNHERAVEQMHENNPHGLIERLGKLFI